MKAICLGIQLLFSAWTFAQPGCITRPILIVDLSSYGDLDEINTEEFTIVKDHSYMHVSLDSIVFKNYVIITNHAKLTLSFKSEYPELHDLFWNISDTYLLKNLPTSAGKYEIDITKNVNALVFMIWCVYDLTPDNWEEVRIE